VPNQAFHSDLLKLAGELHVMCIDQKGYILKKVRVSIYSSSLSDMFSICINCYRVSIKEIKGLRYSFR